MSVVTYVVPLLLLGGVVSAAMLVAVLWRRPVTLGGPEIVGFVALALGATLWTWSYALQLRADSLSVILAYNNLLWIGTGLVGASWPVFAFAVAGDDCWLTRRRIAVVSGVPLAFAALAVSNPAHHLIYADATVVAGEVTRSDVTPGIGYLAFVLWSYTVNVYVLWRLVRSVRGTTGTLRSRRLAVLAAGLLPTLAGLVSIFLFPGDGQPIDFTPVMFAVTTVLTGVAITRYRLLDSIAVAQDHIVNHLSDPVVIVDDDGRIRATNEAARQLFGDERVVGAAVGDAFGAHPDLVEAIRATSGTNAEAVTVTVDWETRRSRADGGDGLTDARSTDDPDDTSVGDPDDPPVGDTVQSPEHRTFTTSVGPLEDTDAAVLVFRDITERRAAERRVTILNRVLRHDLRNDISVIDGYLSLLKTELEASDRESETVRDALSVLSARTEGMLAVTEQAALAERLVDGDPEVRRTDLVALVRSHCEQVRVEHPDVRLETTLPEDPVTVATLSVFPSVVDNLIENAIEHADSDRPWLAVSVAVERSESTATIRVADDGPGIPDDDREVLLGREPSLERANGLGLWLINRITRLSGGDIAVEPSRRGGTAVSVTLPLAASTVDAASDSAA
ncbi:ATP-binding protein [Halobaculum sp. CBA1158]|uniref:histidine kinase N-terminal 7TM domain-containing protein n=1 Tax=Halobaculum sp. CBA1158 TaxID=2904243 RepID=UPI001F205EA7|nr:histidine kinase N-terminal 7TM domain-containing protein [Halobaculum sp. CBA1158]UIO99413.1 ATP-binding protein [Halobaculum sp. CBA1158]